MFLVVFYFYVKQILWTNIKKRSIKNTFVMVSISISDNLFKKLPGLNLSTIYCELEVAKGSSVLWDTITEKIKGIASGLKVEDISKIPQIQASRKAYKACGKDPARYRLSAEALLRRIVKNVALYQINNVVDLLNLVSFSSGFSIGGYDFDKIKGDIIFGIGEEGEAYRGVGKGELNIGLLPVFRDQVGAFGSPTSDSERTMVTENTKRFLMVIIGFGANETLQGTTSYAIELLQNFASAKNIQTQII